MRPRHIVSLVIGILLLAPALGLLIGGGAIGVYELAARDDNGWHAVDVDRGAGHRAHVQLLTAARYQRLHA